MLQTPSFLFPSYLHFSVLSSGVITFVTHVYLIVHSTFKPFLCFASRCPWPWLPRRAFYLLGTAVGTGIYSWPLHNAGLELDSLVVIKEAGVFNLNVFCDLYTGTSVKLKGTLIFQVTCSCKLSLTQFRASRILFDVVFSLAFKDFACPEYVAEMTVVTYFYYIVFFGKFLRITFFFCWIIFRYWGSFEHMRPTCLLQQVLWKKVLTYQSATWWFALICPQSIDLTFNLREEQGHRSLTI